MRHYCIFLLLFLFACQNQPDSSKEVSKPDFTTETQQMIDSLQRIYSETQFRKHPYESAEKLKLVEQEIKAAEANGRLNPKLAIEYGKSLLEAGKSKEAIDLFEKILVQLPENQVINKQTKTLHETLAISYMRLGEQTNCQQNHSNESCILPLKGKAFHTWQDGSKKAIEIYLNILKVFPDDLRRKLHVLCT